MTRARLFGLTLDSEMALPGLTEAEPCADVDVTVRRGCGEGAPDLLIRQVGSFWVRDGREIMVEPADGVPERNIRLFLLGSAMGLLLHQRGLFPLHANACVVGGYALAVAGASGAGKSTLAAWLSRQGLTLVGDDVIALRADEFGVTALPGPPRVRLWRESLDCFGMESDGLEPSYIDGDVDKWDVPVPIDGLASEALPLGAIYVLEDAPALSITRLSGAAAAKALFDHTYRGAYLSQTGGASGHLRTVAQIVATTPIFLLERPRDLSQLEALGHALLTHAQVEAARTGGGGR